MRTFSTNFSIPFGNTEGMERNNLNMQVSKHIENVKLHYYIDALIANFNMFAVTWKISLSKQIDKRKCAAIEYNVFFKNEKFACS